MTYWEMGGGEIGGGEEHFIYSVVTVGFCGTGRRAVELRERERGLESERGLEK